MHGPEDGWQGVSALDEAEADALLALLPSDRPSLLAVSGGPDSTALMGLAAGWALRQGRPRPLVAVVDHGLRPGSAAEAASVSRRAEEFGLDCTILLWAGAKPKTRLQEAARTARYRLLARHAAETGAAAVVTGHTLDDQAETFLMRLARGSGPAGLKGMSAATVIEGARVLRPFLPVSKARLLATCAARGWPWIGDPSNRDPMFERVRWRALAPELAKEGLTAERIATFMRRLDEAEEALSRWAGDALAVAALPGQARALDIARLAELPFAIACRALALWLSAEGSEAGAPVRLARLEAATRRLIASASARNSLILTLAGRVLTLDRRGQLTQRPERRRRGIVNPEGRPLLGKAGDED